MRSLLTIVIGTFVLSAHSANPPLTPQKGPTSIDPISIVILFKDGHQETFAMADIARIEYKDAGDSTPGMDHFLGKWEAGDGNSGTFVITLEPNGEADRSIGASHGIWTIGSDEARVSWDDGWHDVLRKIGDKYRSSPLRPAPPLTISPQMPPLRGRLNPGTGNLRRLNPSVDSLAQAIALMENRPTSMWDVETTIIAGASTIPAKTAMAQPKRKGG